MYTPKIKFIIFIVIVTITVSIPPYLMSSEIQTLNLDSLSDKDISPEGRSALSLFEKDWKHTETGHFIYHFIDEKGAETVLIHAEVYYKWIKDIFGVEEDKWAKKSHVFIFPDQKMWNDFKVKIRFNSPAEAYTTGWELFMHRDPHWISPRVTLAHEITHIIVFRFLNGPLPLFLNEGFAEFISYKAVAMQLTGGNIGFTVLIPKDEFIPLEELTEITFYPTGKREEIFYSESHLLVRFLLLNYENNKFYKLLSEASQGRPFKESLEDIYKIDLKAFQEKFKAYAISKK